LKVYVNRKDLTLSPPFDPQSSDGWDVIQEITSGVKTNYVRSLNIDEPLTRITGATIRHYVTDALGSTVALTDDSGAVKTTYTYDAYGNATATGETSDNPFQYTSRENDGTGLYYYRARYYSPEMQRFISEDPIRLRGGINFFAYVDSVGKPPVPQTNLYQYTHNNPVNYIDPLGLFDYKNSDYWVKLGIGGLSILEGLQTMAIGGGAIVCTGLLTENPVLTGIVAVEMSPVFAAGMIKTDQGVKELKELFHTPNPGKCH
jgi:RHS repeat-associated protein